MCVRLSGRIPPPLVSLRFSRSGGIFYSWWLHCDDGRGHKPVIPRPLPAPPLPSPHHHLHHPTPQNTLFPLNTPLCGDITTILPDSCVSMWPHTAVSLSVCVNSSSTNTLMEPLSTPVKECSRYIIQEYFLKYNTVYSLASKCQPSVNLVVMQYRPEEQLIQC